MNGKHGESNGSRQEAASEFRASDSFLQIGILEFEPFECLLSQQHCDFSANLAFK